MFKSQQYRAKAAEYGELVRASTSPNERRDFQELEDRFAALADNEEGLADVHDGAVCVANRLQLTTSEKMQDLIERLETTDKRSKAFFEINTTRSAS
jgi:NTP pyrophosphatase (non-canonical NTP hydrolase)